jgi:hypothetical protein
MESLDNFRERFEALEQRTEQLQQHTRIVERRLRWWHSIVGGALLLSLLSLAHPSQAADFACTAGDVTCLITAINTANANGEANTITLEAGTYTLTAVDNTTDGPNGLPSVTSTLTIQGAGADTTVIERDRSAPMFRLLHVAATGGLTLEGLTVRGGNVGSVLSGGGLLNRGTLALAHTTVSNNIADAGGGLASEGGLVTIARSTIRGNASFHPGGGIFVVGGALTILRSTLAGNTADGGGALALGVLSPSSAGRQTVVITESAIVDNASATQPGGGLVSGSSGMLVMTNTTIARNRILSSAGPEPGAAGLDNRGTSILTNCTVAENASLGVVLIGGLSNVRGGVLALQNTLVALNTGRSGRSVDCGGEVTSLGHNLIGDPTGCTITLRASDLTGDPGLGAFTDNGTPGNGHFPLRRGSPAIDAGNDAFCPPTDQLGRRRVNIRKVGTSLCDIGAIEFRHRDDHQHNMDPATAAD